VITTEEARSFMRDVREALAPRVRERMLGTTYRAPRVESRTLAELSAAGTAAESVNTASTISVRGSSLTLLMSSNAAAKVEVCFDYAAGSNSSPSAGSGSGAGWFPMVPGTRLRPPTGGQFSGFRVRLQTGAPAEATRLAIFGIDVDTDEQSAELGRFAQVSNGGAVEQILKALLTNGTEVYLEAAAGSGADRGALGVASYDGATYRRLLSLAAALADAAASAAGELLVAAKLQAFNGATWDRIRSGIGAAGTGVLRVVGAIPATAPSTRTSVPATSTSTQLAAANASRYAAMIYNAGAVTVYVAIGEDAAATSQPLPAGDRITVVGSGAINAFNSGAGAADVHVTDFTY
jgi:hypothetical protein